MVTQQEIARRVGLDVSSVNKILNKRVGPRFQKDTVTRVFKAARELGFDFSRLKFGHRRRHDRKPLDLSAVVAIYTPSGALVEEGTGVVRDFSPGGARLSKIVLPSGRLPLKPSVVRLRFKKGGREEEFQGRIIRFNLAEESEVAVEFAPKA